MKGLRLGTLVLIAALAAVATLLVVHVALAQPPAAAPVPAAEELQAPPVPGDRNPDAMRDRIEQLRRMWAQNGGMMPAMPVAGSMAVSGEHVFVLYGPFLCEFAANGLRLEAKVDVREALGLGMPGLPPAGPRP